MRITSLSCLVFATLSQAGGATEPCSAPSPYTGAPLHPALAEEAFPKSGEDIHGALDDALVMRLDHAVDWILERTKAPGITAAVGIPGKGLWSTDRGTAGVAEIEPLAKRPLFHWASVGKAFTAIVVLQLVEEARLRLDDLLARWFPDFPSAAWITIDHLLTHTSGIYSFQADPGFRARRGFWSPAELVELAASHEPEFCPGERWGYSNTGYVLLARIVERIEGRPFHQVVTRRVIEPLGLTHTRALSPEESPPELTTGHVNGRPDTDFEPSTPFGAGIIVGAAGDLVAFWQAYLAGRLARPETVRLAFSSLYPMFDSQELYYGRGVMIHAFEDKGRRETWQAHSGGTPGLKAVVARDIGTGIYVAVALSGPVSAEASANRLLGEARAYLAGQ